MNDILKRIENNDISWDELNAIDISQFSNEDKQKMIEICDQKESYWDTKQMALKISMNSLN